MRSNKRDLVSYIGPTIACVTFVCGIFTYYNKHIDDRIKDLEHICVRKADMDQRIDEKLVPVMQEIRYLRSDVNKGFEDVNLKLRIITEVRVRNQRS